jgi:hypothetical protein
MLQLREFLRDPLANVNHIIMTTKERVTTIVSINKDTSDG